MARSRARVLTPASKEIPFGEADVFARLGVFFSRAAVVTFGRLRGARVGGAARGGRTGLALAAYRHAVVSSPLLAEVLGSILTAWVTFVPSFLWIFLGAPCVERLRHEKPLAAALQAVMAAVVGVIANLALPLGARLALLRFRVGLAVSLLR